MTRSRYAAMKRCRRCNAPKRCLGVLVWGGWPCLPVLGSREEEGLLGTRAMGGVMGCPAGEPANPMMQVSSMRVLQAWVRVHAMLRADVGTSACLDP